MEKLEMIKAGENGQLFFDWESIEAITSKEFVRLVKSEHEMYKNYNHSVVIRDGEYFVKLFYETQSSISVLRYEKETGETDRYFITANDIDLIYAMSKGEYRRG